MLASSIIAKARKLLGDEGADRWTDADLLGWLNGGQRQIVAVRPDAYPQRADLTLVEGSEQTLPTDGIRLLNVIANVSNTKRSIVLISETELDVIDLYWREADSGVPIQHYVFDPSDPTRFEVYPPAAEGQKVRALYSRSPVDLAGVDSPIVLDDTFEGPLIDWVVYRASAQPSDSADDAQRAANSIATFMQALTGKTQSDQANAPARK